jgi:hypothetical protein
MLKKEPGTDDYIFYLCSVSDECPACLRRGLKKNERCPHQLSMLPDHLSSLSQRLLQVLYEGDEAFGEQELTGNPVCRSELPFAEFTARFLASAYSSPHHFTRDVQVIYSFFDPSGGGASNATVYSCTVGEDGVRVLIGMDCCKRSETLDGFLEKTQMLRRHYASIRKDPRYHRALIVIAIEVGANPDLSNQTGKDILSHFGREGILIIKGQIKEPTWYGVVTTAEEKRNWTHHAVHLFKNEKIRIAADPLIGARAKDVELPELCKELDRWRRQLETVNKDHEEKQQSTKEYYTGKPDPDDRCVAFISCLWQREVLIQNASNEFHKVCHRNGFIHM